MESNGLYKKFRARFHLANGNNRNKKSPLLPCGEAGLFYHMVGSGKLEMRNAGGGFATKLIGPVKPVALLVPSH